MDINLISMGNIRIKDDTTSLDFHGNLLPPLFRHTHCCQVFGYNNLNSGFDTRYVYSIDNYGRDRQQDFEFQWDTDHPQPCYGN